MSRRSAVTLIELLVVIVIIAVIAGLAAAFLPRLSRQHSVTDAAGSIQGWLMQAKSRAKRDGLTTGLRLMVEPNSGGSVYRLQPVQQPSSLAGGQFIDPNNIDPATGRWRKWDPINMIWVVDFVSPPPILVPFGKLLLLGGVCQSAGIVAGEMEVSFGNVDFSLGGIPPAQWLVQPGDSFTVHNGPARLITAVPSGNTIRLARTPYNMTLTVPASTTDYRIIRQARPLIGEAELTLPRGTVIDTFLARGFGVELQPAPGGYDVLFQPSGECQPGLAVLWVRDEDKTFDKSGLVSLTTQIEAPGGTDDQALVGVNRGMIQVQAVSAEHLNPFVFLLRP